MNDFGDIHFNELIERFNLMGNDLLAIRLIDERANHVAISGNVISNGHGMSSGHDNDWCLFYKF